MTTEEIILALTITNDILQWAALAYIFYNLVITQGWIKEILKKIGL